jgi:hypothetical protein
MVPSPIAATAPAPATVALMKARLLTPFHDSLSAISVPPSKTVCFDLYLLGCNMHPPHDYLGRDSKLPS